ncbi:MULTISPECIES: aldolase/citrate lyase family protein [unclassified Kitasatospora]|uniref:HpcH/HpaI aldolase family protein n=1 Tax=unclassified Kitasatospora TaxID=2633591 RepID=UPI0033C5D47A
MTGLSAHRSTSNGLSSRLQLLRQPGLGDGLDPSLLGLFLLWSEPGIAELCGLLPLDFVVIDMEAGALGRPEVLRMTQALAGRAVSVLVRVPSHDQHAIEHALDIGADGVMVPKVSTRAEAEAVAAATRFPPAGRRGVNPVRASGYFGDLPGYFEQANDRVLCVVQIETAHGVGNAEAIAAVPGVDGLFLGMGDLAMALGQPGVTTGSAMDEARTQVLEGARKHAKLAGAFAYGLATAREYRAEGFDMIAVGNDIKLLREGIEQTLAQVRAPGGPALPQTSGSAGTAQP